MTVITISRQFASGGDEIALSLCQELGFKLFDKRIITAVAKEAGVSEQNVVDISEDDYQVHGFWDRLLDRMTILPYTGPWADDLYTLYLLEENKISEEDRFELVHKAILYARRLGNLIILGRGGQVILKDQPGVIHLRIEAPLEERIQRIKLQFKDSTSAAHADIEMRRKAQELILEKDAASRDYLKHFYNVDWESPLLYHLVLNTGLLSIPQAVKVIVELAHTFEVAGANA
jgi:CMP/dCMP kinase